jgi:hypothetical protein
MPTALPQAFSRDIDVRRNDALLVSKNGDFAAVAAFTVIGLTLAIGLTAYFPSMAAAVALALSAP